MERPASLVAAQLAPAIRLAALSAVAFFSCLAPATAQLPVAELKSIFPPGGKQGTSFDVQVSGADLDGPASLLFSHPGIVAAPKMEEAGPLVKTPRALDNQFTVTIAPDVPPGIYEARVVGRYGASNPRAFAVGSLEDVRDNGNNRTPATAQEIPVGVVVSGVAEGDNIDYYKLNLKQGQRVIVDCWARRLDSRMESLLILWDEQGNELSSSRDIEGHDALLDFTAPADGAYIVGVCDFLYRGGPEYFYRLRAHSGPHVDFVFPPVAEPGKSSKLTVYGRNLPGSQLVDGLQLAGRPLEKLEVEVTPPGDEKGLRQLAVTTFVRPNAAALDTFAWQFTSPQGSADAVAIDIATAPVIVEQEPNDEPAQAAKISVPCEYVGQFYPEGDRDFVEFEAKKGDVFWLTVVAHRRGLDSDPFLLVQKVVKNDQGEEQVSEVAQVDDPADRNNRIGSDFDTSTDDPSFRLEANEDATYRVQVRDQFNSGRLDPRYIYRLIIRREQPDFRLTATPEPAPAQNNNQVLPHATVLRRGGSALVQVQVERLDGFTGEVEITAEGLPPGVSCVGAVLGGQVKQGALVFTAEENAAPWRGPVAIVGKAKIGDQEAVRYARAGAIVWGTNNRQQQPPISRLARDLVLSVIDKETEPVVVKIGDGGVVETSKGGKVEIPVTFTWRGEIKGDLALAPVGAPNEFQVKNITAKPGQADAKVEFVLSNNNVQPGAYTFYLRGQSKIDYERNTDLVKEYEERQKEIDATINELQVKAKQAAEAKNQAVAAAQQAANEVKQKEQAVQAAKPEEATQANQELAQAREKAQAAEQAKAAAEEADRQAQELVKQATERKKQIDNQLNEVKKNNTKKEVTFYTASTPVKVRIAPDPLNVTVAPLASAIKQGDKLETTVTVERLYGFDDQVEVTFEPPGGVNGLSAPKITIPKDQQEGKLEITAANNATVGEHTINIRFRVRFNNVQLDDVVPLAVKVEMAEANQ